MIRRDLPDAAGRVHELIIVGGGAQGVAFALEAALRGKRPLLLERDDFGGATTWNHLRIVHGGLRYLQRLDLRRFRESVVERTWHLRAFPDLVRPIACLLPLYGEGLKRSALLRPALALNDLLSVRRNAGVREDRRLPGSRLHTAEETAALFPAVRRHGLQSAALWYDAVTERPERLLMEQIRWACAAGASAINYVEARDLVTAGGAAAGVEAVDRVGGRTLSFRAPVVIDATGPWVGSFRSSREGDLFRPSLAFNLLLRRPPLSPHAIAVSAPGAGSHVYFALPWGGDTLVGTCHAPWPPGEPLEDVPPDLLSAMLADLEAAVPGWGLRPEDVARVYSGLLPVGEPGEAEPAGRPLIRFHDERGGPRGLVSVVAVKFTTARRVARQVLDRLFGSAAGPGSVPRPAPAPVPDREAILDLAARSPARAAEVASRIAREEAVVHPEDLYLRRADWGRDPAHLATLDTLARRALQDGMDGDGAPS